jgi:hypothetical protein
MKWISGLSWFYNFILSYLGGAAAGGGLLEVIRWTKTPMPSLVVTSRSHIPITIFWKWKWVQELKRFSVAILPSTYYFLKIKYFSFPHIFSLLTYTNSQLPLKCLILRRAITAISIKGSASPNEPNNSKDFSFKKEK